MKTKTRRVKGQSSIEFLMTYGWAIVIISVALVLLWQWGFFNPTGNIKFSSLGFWGLLPADAKYTSEGDLTISIRNEIVDGDVNITEITVRTGAITDVYTPNPPILVPSGTMYTYYRSHTDSLFSGGGDGASYDLLVTITYIDNRLNSSEYPAFRSSGNIQSSIEGA